jgi:microcystin-dependent protein
MFAGNFPPAGWALCNGALQAISENDTLFNLIGTTYGGDGQSTFALPDLQGRFPMHQGNGHILGEKGGTETVTLSTNQIPAHSHQPTCNTNNGGSLTPGNNVWAAQGALQQFSAAGTENVFMNSAIIAPTGGSQPHENMMPYLGINFIISLFGIFPSQT